MKVGSVDFSGFTKQTETLLRGIGANDLVQEFKKRDISTDVLHKLTKEDFMLLGASEDHAEHMLNTLNVSKKKNLNKRLQFQKTSDNIEILKVGEKQLTLIQAFAAYCRFRLKEERINFFVEPDKALSASQILCIAADATLKEINEAELKLTELEAIMITPKHRSIYSYILYCGSISIMCFATFKLLINRFWK